MRELGLVPCQPRPWRPATTQQSQAGPIPDLVNRDFTADVPGQKMVGDITYIPTWEGWSFLATVIDCATRKVIGWAIDDNYRTPLISAAIEMAARNLNFPAGAVFHSDRAATTRLRSSVPSWKAWISGSPSTAPASATTMRWPSHLTRPLKSSGSTVPSTRQEEKQPRTLRGTSNSGTIGHVSTRGLAIRLRKKSTTNT
jgi:hypothetical protein